MPIDERDALSWLTTGLAVPIGRPSTPRDRIQRAAEEVLSLSTPLRFRRSTGQ